MKTARLKSGREKALLNHHHWIFSGAVVELPDFENGELLRVESYSGQCLGAAYFNRKASIIGRMVAFGEEDPYAVIKNAIIRAVEWRKSLFDENTNAYRLINAEGDFLPGLIVDRYHDVLVVQISTLGMERLKPLIIESLQNILNPTAIYEKSELGVRKEEGLNPIKQLLAGNMDSRVKILEHGLSFYVDIANGQKTGFFLDQREMRALVRELSSQKRVLNCFAYTGGFSIYALAGKALSVDSVDISKEAIELAQANCQLNGFSSERSTFITEDVFEFLRKSSINQDLVILDPPAFAKKAKDVVPACRGYKDINRLALQKMPAGSTLISCSCSHFVDEKLFQQVLFQAAAEAKRNVRIIGRHRQASDHPINLFHPEGDYLKSLVLAVE